MQASYGQEPCKSHIQGRTPRTKPSTRSPAGRGVTRTGDDRKRLLIGAHFRNRNRRGAAQSESHTQPRREKWLAHPKVSNTGGGRETTAPGTGRPTHTIHDAQMSRTTGSRPNQKRTRFKSLSGWMQDGQTIIPKQCLLPKNTVTS